MTRVGRISSENSLGRLKHFQKLEGGDWVLINEFVAYSPNAPCRHVTQFFFQSLHICLVTKLECNLSYSGHQLLISQSRKVMMPPGTDGAIVD